MRRRLRGNGACARTAWCAGDLDDSKANWAVERRKIASGDHDGVAIVGGSRILFDTDLDAWQELTGRRPVQLALAGMSGQRFLADLAANSEFGGLVVIDVTPEQFFREGPGNPEFEGVLDYWSEEEPARRFGHRVGQFISRYLAFLDDQYSLTSLIDQVDIPNRGKIGGPYLGPGNCRRPMTTGRQSCGGRSKRTSGCAPMPSTSGYSGTGRRPTKNSSPGSAPNARESVAKIRARGGDVVFIRPPSTGGYYEREQRMVPRATTWDRLLRDTGTFGIHFEDYPEMQGLDLAELSHLTRESATRFTRAYVGVLRERYVWLRTLPESQPGS